jgi:superfamily II DNA helicase RecQ
MNIKVFNIRLDKDNCDNDQNLMNAFLDSVEVKLTSTNFVTTGTVDFWSAVVFYDLKKSESKPTEVIELNEKENAIFTALKLWRSDLAQKKGWSSFRICHNSHLISIAKENPQSIEELKKVKGFGESRTVNYGEDIIALLNSF